MFHWENARPTADMFIQADVGKTCFILDDATVAKTNGTNTRSECGVVVQVDTAGVWVEAKN